MPFDAGNCGKNPHRFIEIGGCRQGIVHPEGANLFPNKIPRNLNRCPLHIIAIAKAPYTIFPPGMSLSNLTSNMLDVRLTEGFEVKLMQTISDDMNLEAVFG